MLGRKLLPVKSSLKKRALICCLSISYFFFLLTDLLLLQVKEKNMEILTESGIDEHSAKNSVPHERNVWCYPIQFALPSPVLPTVDFVQE